jgi:hypothetical protein
MPGCPGWELAAGFGELISWVVYHPAPQPVLRARLPYAVAIVELDEGPRMIASLQGVPGDARPWCGARVVLSVVDVEGLRLARFGLVAADSRQSDSRVGVS